MTACKELEVILTTRNDGSCALQLDLVKGGHDACKATELEAEMVEPVECTFEEPGPDSLVKSLMAASHPKSLLTALKEAWKPSSVDEEMGVFERLNDGEVLLNTVPLFQKLVSCMAWTMTDHDGALACADLLAQLCLGVDSSLLLQPREVLTTIQRLVISKRRETREGALRCMTSLIKCNLEYCQSFMDCRALDFILDQIDYNNEAEVAAYACKSVLSLVRLVSNDDANLEMLLSRALPTLVNMLSEENEIQTKLNALICLEEIRQVQLVAEELKEDAMVQFLAPLLKTEHPEIQRLALEMFGKSVHEDNSEGLKSLSVSMAYALLKETFEAGTEGLEVLRLTLLDTLLTAVHRKEFPIQTPEAQLMSEIILRDAKACASKAIDILVVAWDLHDDMAADLAKSDRFLAQLPHAMSVTQAALHIIHSMFQADLAAAEAMAKNMGSSEIECLRMEMQNGTDEVKIIVLDIFAKLLSQEEHQDAATSSGILADLVEGFDSGSVGIRRRCWTLCALILQARPEETTQKCIGYGLVGKYDILFTDFLDYQKSEAEEPIHYETGLDDLFTILQSISSLKSGARAICDTGILSRLFEFVTPKGIVCREIRNIVMNVLTTLPVKTSRLLAQHCGFDVLTELLKSRNVQLKRLGFEILKSLSFKECSTYLSDSGLIPQLCLFLHESNTRLKSDTVFVLCRMSRFAMNEVCLRIEASGGSSALWTASRSLAHDSEEKRLVWKMFQKLKSMEASHQAEKKRIDRVVSRLSSFGSISVQEHADLMQELNKSNRGASISLPTGRSRGLHKATSMLADRLKRVRMVSCDSDVALKKEDNLEPSTGRFQRFRSLTGLRRSQKASNKESPANL